MAYTSAPETQTYSTQRLPAAYDIDLRPNSLGLFGNAITQDSCMINLLPFKYKNQDTEEIHAETRNSIKATFKSSAQSVLRGMYVWEKALGTIYYYAVCGTFVYTSTDAVTWAQVDTLLTAATTPVRFTEFIDATNVKKLVMVDGVEGYVYTTNAAGTKITDVDFPTPHVPFPVFLDGYLFLAKANTGDIYNSNLNDPALWTAGDFISSELYPDDIQALVKINNYLLAIGTQGSEYFYDAANATASPLARYEGASLPFGTSIPNSIASNKNTVMMITNNNDGENTIRIIEDFKHKDIKSDFIITILNSRINSLTLPTTTAAVRGFFFRQGGKLFYGLSTKGNSTDLTNVSPSFAYSFETGWWTETRYGLAGFFRYPVNFTALSTTGKLVTFVAGHCAAGGFFFGSMYEGSDLGYATTSADYGMESGVTEVPLYTELRTSAFDFGTLNAKTMSRFGVNFTTGGGSSAAISVYWNDRDYDSAANIGPRNITVNNSLDYFPFITQLGQFRRRSFKITYDGPAFLRYKYLEVDINKGQQ